MNTAALTIILAGGARPVLRDTFDTYPSDAALAATWSAFNSGVLSLSSGAMRVTNGGTAFGAATRLITGFADGARYRVRANHVTKASSSGLYCWISNTQYGVAIKDIAVNRATLGTFEDTFVAARASQWINFRASSVSGEFFEIDDVLIERVRSSI